MKHKMQKWVVPILGILVITAVFFIGAYYFVSNTQKDVDSQNKQYLSELAVQNAYTIKASVDTQIDNLESLSNIVGYQGEFSVETMMQILDAEYDRGKFKRLGFATIDGQAITTDNQSFNVSDRSYFKSAMQGKCCVSDVMEDKVGGGYINVYAVPLYCDEKIQGTIFATSDTTLFSNVLNIRSFHGEGYAYIIKQDGTPVILGNNKNMANFDNLFDEMRKGGVVDSDVEKMQKAIKKNHEGIIEYNRDGVARVGAYCEIGINDWYVVSVVPREVILESSDRLLFRSRVSAGIIILLLIALVCFIVIQNQKNSRKLENLAYVDPLTKGYNLNKFKSLVRQKIAQKTGDLYMVRIDIDNFKFINDMYGYTEGDEILLDMHRLIAECISEQDIFGRTGNDNFLCLIRRNSQQEVLDMGILFRGKFKSLLKEKGKRYAVNFTTGVYPIPLEETDIEKIIDRATMAHRKAKLLPKERKFFVYNDEIRKEAVNVKDIEDVMDQALASKEFLVYLQPKYNIFTREIIGAEALIRWKRNGKIISPAEFLPIFEKNGFITSIDMYVLEEVCKMQREWLDKGMHPVPISINQSKALIYGSDYLDKLSSTLLRYNMPSRLIELELLETIIHDNVIELKEIISKLRNQGFLICIDDFGSGYSSLNLLKDICADVLKIDREFLSNAECNARAQIVLEHIIDLADDLEMSTVVEGVETENQADLLRKLKCHYAQGYLYARPMPKEEYEQLFL